jgi:hypothetical protein
MGGALAEALGTGKFGHPHLAPPPPPPPPSDACAALNFHLAPQKALALTLDCSGGFCADSIAFRFYKCNRSVRQIA